MKQQSVKRSYSCFTFQANLRELSSDLLKKNVIFGAKTLLFHYILPDQAFQRTVKRAGGGAFIRGQEEICAFGAELSLSTEWKGRNVSLNELKTHLSLFCPLRNVSQFDLIFGVLFIPGTTNFWIKRRWKKKKINKGWRCK